MSDTIRRRLRFRIKASAYIEEVGTLEELAAKEKETIKKLEAAVAKLPAVMQHPKVKPIGWEMYNDEDKKWVPAVIQSEQEPEPEAEDSPGDKDV